MINEMRLGSLPCHCRREGHKTKLVAITGGPGGGKSAVLEMAHRSFCSHVQILPEAASIAFGGGFPRHDTLAGQQAAQRAIYHLQRQLETLVVEEREAAVALCDRGTVDGLAYWPGHHLTYWDEVGTSLPIELSRYVAVIHLETPHADQGYNHQNALRIESAEQAQDLDQRIVKAWSGHPRRFVVPSATDFVDKAITALGLIRDELPSCCHSHELTTEGHE